MTPERAAFMAALDEYRDAIEWLSNVSPATFTAARIDRTRTARREVVACYDRAVGGDPHV